MKRLRPGPRARVVAVLSAALGAATVVVVAPGQAGSAGAAPLAPAPAATRPAVFAPFSVTLVTGDRVQVRPDGDKYAASVTAGAGRKGMAFSVRSSGDRLEVVPADAAPLLAADRLDRRLFELLGLRRLGYHDGARADIPVLVTGSREAAASGGPRSAASSAVSPSGRPAGRRAVGPVLPRARAGAREVAALPLLGVRSLRAGKASAGTFWAATKAAAAAGAPTAAAPGARTADPARPAGPVEKTWLVGKRRLDLDRSVRQIGAPAAWRAGLTGKGVTVAVLDTGYDRNHPDLQGVVKSYKDFTGTGLRDTVGHGTHVASIVAGRGTASAGKHVGVARGASLAVGKVCTDYDCPDDMVLAGMEWAAASGAKVVNMSLGGSSGVEDDPVEQAVETLTARTGTLFVCSAGNDGPGERTVGSPGTAPSAVSVGSVDRDDTVSDFSSRGPAAARTDIGPRRVKPDITAPGDRIVAARAAGTLDDYAVDDDYAALPGTSMAAPHVAGAAAVLAQKNPSLTPAQLKAALTSTAAPTPGATAYDQGAGRLDLARAVGTPLTASTGVLDLGTFPWPNAAAKPVTHTLTYANTGRRTLTLTVRTELTRPDGRPAPARALTADRSRLTLRPGQTGAVTLTFRPATVRPGLYSGRLTLTTADGRTRATTALGGYREPEAYDLTVATVGRGGTPAETAVEVVEVSSGKVVQGAFQSGTSTYRLRAGRYAVVASTFEERGDRYLTTQEVRPVRVHSDSEVSFDARRGRALAVSVDRRDAAPFADVHAYSVFAASEHGVAGPPGTVFLVGGQRVEGMQAAFWAFFTKRGSGDPAEGRRPTPFTYNVAVNLGDRLPAAPTYRFRQSDFAELRNTYARGSDVEKPATQVGGDPFVAPAGVLIPSDRVELGDLVVRSDFVSRGTAWIQRLHVPSGDTGSETWSDLRAYEAGKVYRDRWNVAVLGPTLPGGYAPGDYFGSVRRAGDALRGWPRMRSDATGHEAGAVNPGAPGNGYRLYRDGDLIWEQDILLPIYDAPLSPAPATYRLEAEVTNPVATDLSARQTVAWTFRSGHVEGEQPLPLSVVRYFPAVDGRNTAPAGPFSVPVRVERQAGSKAAPLASLAVAVSYDGGRSWAAAKVSGTGQERTLRLAHPAGAGTVSLRATAVDTAGNRVEQTVLTAYRLR